MLSDSDVSARAKDANTTIHVDEERCQGCGLCVDVCPKGAIHIEGGLAIVDQARCDLCIAQPEALCVSACPQQAIYLIIVVEAQPELPVETQPSREVVPIALEAKPPSVIGQLARSPALYSILGFIGKEVLPRALDTFLARWYQPKAVTTSNVSDGEELPKLEKKGVPGQRGRHRRGGKRHGWFSGHGTRE
jgi:ferredoxin